jgi:hypothetical protein
MTQEKRAGMATWLKITIAVLVIGFASAAILVTIGAVFLFDASRKALDPQYVSKVAESVAKFDEPLPDGFRRIMAVDVMGMSEVGFANQHDGLTIMFMKMQSNPKNASADFLVDSYIKSGVPNAPGSVAHFQNIVSPPEIQSKGKILVGGEEMPYAIAERSCNGLKTFQMVGCVVPARTGRPIVILGQSSKPTLQRYPLELTKKLLAAVRGF